MDEHRDRTWDQFIRFYTTFSQVQGSYIWAMQMTDDECIEEMLAIPAAEWNKPRLPSLFGWSNVIDKLTDIGDQLIAQRATGDKVRFYPRPRIPAAELRKKNLMNKQEDLIEASRRKNREMRERRGLI